MRFLPIHSMRARMTLVLALAIAIFMGLLSTIYLIYVRNTMEQNFAASLDRIAEESQSLVRQPPNLIELRTQIESHNAQVARSGAISEGVEAWLLDSQGRAIWLSHKERLHPIEVPDLPASRPENAPIPPLDKPEDWRIRTIQWGEGKLILALPWHRARREFNSQMWALFGISAFISAVAAFGGWILVDRTLHPIDALAKQAQNASENPVQMIEPLPALQATSSDREIRHLVSTLNQMLNNVREASLSKERFHTSASHELRTPLQALGGHLGVTLARDRSVEEYKIALQEAASQTTRLSKLTGDLLLLNRLQTAASTPLKETVDVAEVCDIALQRASRTIESRNLTLVEDWQDLEVEAAPSHLEILLGNLIENAAKYATENGKIGVEINSVARTVQIWNECRTEQLELLSREIPRLFEPFYRPDSSRTGETGGNGLGLAICQSIVEANGWKLEAQAKEQKFAVTLMLG